MGKVIVFGNQKGGVGKTTLTTLVANTLSQAPFNKKVLVIDSDNQQSLSKSRNDDLVDQPDADVPYRILSCKGKPKLLHDLVVKAKKTNDYIFVDLAGKLEEETKLILFDTDILFVPFQAGNYGLDSTIEYIQFAIKASQTKEKNGFSPIKIVGFINMFIKGRKEHGYLKEELEDVAEHILVMKNNVGFYSSFMDIDTLETMYQKSFSSSTAKNNFRLWINELTKIIG